MTQKEKEKFAKSLAGKSLEELNKIEENLVKQADKVDEAIAKKMFAVPAEGYKEAAEAIRYFLNKQTIAWQYTLGLKTLYEFWVPATRPEEVNYPTLDATLRNIGSMNFTGYDEWQKVVAINEFFKPLHDDYVKASQDVYDVAEKHNMVMDAKQVYETAPAATNE